LNDLEKVGNSESDLNPPSRQNESNTSSQGLKQLETVQVCSMRRNQLKDLRQSYLVGQNINDSKQGYSTDGSSALLPRDDQIEV
jgi:hypothetical protein